MSHLIRPLLLAFLILAPLAFTGCGKDNNFPPDMNLPNTNPAEEEEEEGDGHNHFTSPNLIESEESTHEF